MSDIFCFYPSPGADLKDIVILTVEDSDASIADPDPTNTAVFHTCATFPGPVGDGARQPLQCFANARYFFVMLVSTEVRTLRLAEVKIYGGK